MEISVKLPDNLYKNVSHLARAKKKTVAEFVKNAVRKAVDEEAETLERPLADCSDEEVLFLANMKMSETENARMSELLGKQREETISPLERNELDALFRVYQVGNLRKSQGIYEAVERGLIKTPDDLK
ncbi:MAG: ribbon-helix-helix protein, CopG family [Pyrinomonadaceae bacterium]